MGEALKRLRSFVRIQDGFQLAEADLEIRGPGDYLGLRQSGRPGWTVGHPLQDLGEFLKVRQLAEQFWETPQHFAYRERWGLGGDVADDEGFFGLD